MLTAGVAHGAGADLYFERRGSGPLLLLIVGGGGDCGYYDRLAAPMDLPGEFAAALRPLLHRLQVLGRSDDGSGHQFATGTL